MQRIDFSDAIPFKIDGVYCKLLSLTRGYYVIVMAADYSLLAQHLWRPVMYKGRVGTVYRMGRKVDVAWGWKRRSSIILSHFIRGNGKPPVIPQGLTIDHKNGVPLDNRRTNLRLANRQQQTFNTRGWSRLGVKNVYRYTYKDSVYFRVDIKTGPERHTFSCATLEQAIRYRDEFLVRRHGEFARTDCCPTFPV